MFKNKKLETQLINKIDEFDNLNPNDEDYDKKSKKLLDDILPHMVGEDEEAKLYNFTCILTISRYITEGYDFIENTIKSFISTEQFDECLLYFSISYIILTHDEIKQEVKEDIIKEDIIKHNALLNIFLEAREKYNRKTTIELYNIPYTKVVYNG